MNTEEYLNATKTARDLKSDGELARYLGCSRQYISKYRHEGYHLNNAHAFKVAQALDLEPATIIADIEQQKAKTPAEKAMWRTIASFRGMSAQKGIATVALLATLAGCSGIATYAIGPNGPFYRLYDITEWETPFKGTLDGVVLRYVTARPL